MASNSLAKDQKGNQRKFTLHSRKDFSAFPVYAQWSEIDIQFQLSVWLFFFKLEITFQVSKVTKKTSKMG